MTSDLVVVQKNNPSECMYEPDGLDWATARRLWGQHSNCPPGCRAQLSAGAALSSEAGED